ncbi:MAG: hypothetical protein K2W99_04400 [Chthoniobacterales bacterium]|nr:hypothetical protein [Chthoniobacterales bacterium]
MIHFTIIMKAAIKKTATVADLRNQFRRISSWIEQGEIVSITRRGNIFAELVPPPKPKKVFKMPDFLAQAKKIWGDRPPLTQAQVREMKEWELEGQEG